MTHCPKGAARLACSQPLHSGFSTSLLPGALEAHPPCLPTLLPPAPWGLRAASPAPVPCPRQPSSASPSVFTRWQPITSASPTASSTAMTTGRWLTTWPRKTEVCVQPVGNGDPRRCGEICPDQISWFMKEKELAPAAWICFYPYFGRACGTN